MSTDGISRTHKSRRPLDGDYAWPTEPIMSLALTCDQATTLITVSGEIDMSNAHLLTEMVEFACHPPTPTIAVDLSAVTFFGAHGVSALLRAQDAVARAEADFRLPDPAPCVTYILAATGVLGLFDPDGALRAPEGALRTSDGVLRAVAPALDGGRSTTGWAAGTAFCPPRPAPSIETQRRLA
ncbi:STAS domain-containing protein [Micromonospora sp. DT233]|uniref:STAS domain-containing protein n=1 Tax=Micromonospora sp. DT233 TaxID=3393432 RepID=UPI003CE7BB5F